MKPKATKSKLHPRNQHHGRYDFTQLMASCPALAPFVRLNAYGDLSIDFFNPDAVKMLNTALLKQYYHIVDWDIPKNYLCPPIPGRADYIHHIADLLSQCHNGKVPTSHKIKCLDIGVGANCIYPIIGNKEYGWSFIGTDIDATAIASANNIIALNPVLKNHIKIRLQPDPKHIFQGILQKNEWIDIAICNPPFHVSLAAAEAGTLRKLRNLTGKETTQVTLNFGGKNNELWCDGGEKQFVCDMIRQSQQFASTCFWFSALISKEANLDSIYRELKRAAAFEIKTLPMGQGNKISRIVAWTFLDKQQQQAWIKTRWR